MCWVTLSGTPLFCAGAPTHFSKEHLYSGTIEPGPLVYNSTCKGLRKHIEMFFTSVSEGAITCLVNR